MLELACGSGRLTVKSGALLTAGDISSAMLDRARAAARENAVSPRFVELDMRDFDLGTKFDVVVIAANS